METVKVDLPNGATAELYAEMKHKTQRAVEAMTRQYLTYPEGVGKMKVTQGEDGGPLQTKVGVDKVEVTIDLKQIDWTAVMEIIILNQVASWSFGEVTSEVLDEQSEAVYGSLKAQVNALYQGVFPLVESGAEN